MSRWSLHAFRLIEPDDQLDLFACREVRWHLAARQLELGQLADRTLCNGFLPARPRWKDLQGFMLKDPRLCPGCLSQLRLRKDNGSASSF